MASGNRPLTRTELSEVRSFPLYIPVPLKSICIAYQSRRRLPSLNAALIELLETHPAVAELVAGVYAAASQEKG